VLDALADLHPFVATFACATAARELFPRYPEPVPSFLPPAWVSALRTPA
jgi:hypothetical protein